MKLKMLLISLFALCGSLCFSESLGPAYYNVGIYIFNKSGSGEDPLLNLPRQELQQYLEKNCKSAADKIITQKVSIQKDGVMGKSVSSYMRRHEIPKNLVGKIDESKLEMTGIKSSITLILREEADEVLAKIDFSDTLLTGFYKKSQMLISKSKGAVDSEDSYLPVYATHSVNTTLLVKLGKAHILSGQCSSADTKEVGGEDKNKLKRAFYILLVVEQE